MNIYLLKPTSIVYLSTDMAVAKYTWQQPIKYIVNPTYKQIFKLQPAQNDGNFS